MDEIERALQLRTAMAEQRVHFIRSEISLGLTFAEVAATTHDAQTRTRNIGHARKAHDMGASLMRDARLTDAQRDELNDQLTLLSARLDELAA
jgi:hypothetical protein